MRTSNDFGSDRYLLTDHDRTERHGFAVWQRVHKARIDAGQMVGWYFLSRVFPSGTDSQYDFITVNAYPKKGPQWDPKVVQSAVSKEEWEEMGDVDQLRTLVRDETWHPMLKTTPRKK